MIVKIPVRISNISDTTPLDTYSLKAIGISPLTYKPRQLDIEIEPLELILKCSSPLKPYDSFKR
jgi:hypothetical protein